MLVRTTLAPELHTALGFLAPRLLPIEQSVVEVFTQTLKNTVVVPDSRSFVLTGGKITL